MKPKTFSYPKLVKKFPAEVKKIFEIFGDDIRLVGGSVRDLLLEKEVSDFDFATRFLPQDVEKILQNKQVRAIPTGAKFGTITAVINGRNLEITTLRKDHETDGRHCVPQFVDDFFEDAARRDFTINALYLDSQGSVYDYFGGINDLKNQKVKFIGDAKKRIEEDFLRILRFFRFSCNYAKSLDRVGLAACVVQKRNLIKISRERIRQEFLKMLQSKKDKNLLSILAVLEKKKITDDVISSSFDLKAFERLQKIEKNADIKLKLATLFLNKETDLEVFEQEICATNLEKKYFKFFTSNSPSLELLAFFDKETVLNFYLFCLAKGKKVPAKDLKFVQKFSSPAFPLDGQDMMDLGFKGEEIGEALTRAKKFWAEKKFKPQRQQLLDFLE